MLVCCALVTAVLAPGSVANADGLKHKKTQVNHKIHRAQVDLDEISSRLLDATAALRHAQGQLDQARTVLAQARGQLSAARALDAQMQAKLAAAEQRLAQAKASLSAGRQKVADQKGQLAGLVAARMQDGDPALIGVSMMLRADGANQLTDQMAAVDSVVDQQAATLDNLRASRILLAVQEQQVAAARDEVAKERAAAARNLERRRRLEAAAQAAAQQVAERVRERREARQAAVRARAQELRRVHSLQRERERIKHKLQALAAKRAAAKASHFDGHSTGYLDFPVNGPITSPYGMRLHPILHIWELHDGTDFGVNCGTPVHAAASGRVIAEYYNAGYGNRLIVSDGRVHGVNLATGYNHLRRDVVRVGQYVHRGQLIAFSGNTGWSTGCHLHFMVFVNGRTVDPMGWL